MSGTGNNNSNSNTRAGNAAPASTTDQRNQNIAERLNPNDRPDLPPPPSRPDNSPDPLDPNRVGDAVVGSVQNQVIRNVVNNATDGSIGPTGSAMVASIISGLIEGRDFDQIATNFVIQQGTSMVMQGMVSANVITPLAVDPLLQSAGSFSIPMDSVGLGTININPLAIIGGVIVGSVLSDMAETSGGAVGGQIGSVIGSVLIPIPVVGAAIGQIIGTLIGDALNRDGLAERHGTFNNNSSNPDDTYATTAFGTFGMSDTHWFGEDQQQGKENFIEAIQAIDNTFAENLNFTPEQMAQAQENLANTNNTYDFGMEHTGWHPSNRIITDRYAAILDVVDPNLGDIVRFSDPDRAGGVQAVLSTALTLAAEIEKGNAKPEDIEEIAEIVKDNLFTDVYMQDPEVKDPAGAYETEPAYLTEGREEWEANEERQAEEYLAEVAEIKDEILANSDPDVVAAYNNYMEEYQEYRASYDSKSGRHMGAPPEEPPPEVMQLHEELTEVAPPNPPLYVSNPLVPVYDSKGNQAGVAPIGSLALQGELNDVTVAAGLSITPGATGDLTYHPEDIGLDDPFAFHREIPEEERVYDSKGNIIINPPQVFRETTSLYSDTDVTEDGVADEDNSVQAGIHTVDTQPQASAEPPESTEPPPPSDTPEPPVVETPAAEEEEDYDNLAYSNRRYDQK